jgi:branched-chain amino acid transport system permease protein
LQIIANGILLGGIYVCASIGFSLVWGVMNMLNATHGSMMMLAGYITYFCFLQYNLDPFISLLITMAISFGFGYCLQRFLINNIIKAGLFMTFILLFGVDMMLINTMLLLWTADVRSIEIPYTNVSFSIGDVNILYYRLAIFIVALLLTFLLFVFLSKTKTGRSIQATRMDLEAARIMGIRTDFIYAITFGISSALAAAAGSMVVISYPISPVLGITFLFKAFVVCILGGLGNINAVIAGGILYGLVENLTAIYIGPSYQEMAPFVLMVLVLAIRPSGLFGKEYY